VGQESRGTGVYPPPCIGQNTTLPVGGWGSPVCCFPPCGVSPRGVWGLCPLRSSDDAFSMMMSPRAEPTSGCSEPDSSWQSAAARPGTTLSVPAPGRPPGHRHCQLSSERLEDNWQSGLLSSTKHRLLGKRSPDCRRIPTCGLPGVELQIVAVL